MASDVEMSLEEIIKKKKVPFRSAVGRPNNANQRQNVVQGKRVAARVGDARNKLILQRRTQIADLRDKLSKKDVRLKLEQSRMLKSTFRSAPGRNIGYNNIQESRRQLRYMTSNINRGFVDLSRQVSTRPLPAPPKFILNRQVGYSAPKFSSMHSDRITSGYKAIPKPILRTVENDVYLPQAIVIDDDVEPLLPIHGRTIQDNLRTSLNFKITAENDHLKDKIGFLSRNRMSERREERMPPSILKKRPMAALRMDRDRRRSTPPPAAPAPPPAPPLEYRIVVSNLRSSVTGTDIQELFGDVGGLVESRLVRPGTAEVIYDSLEYAQKAVDLYHNRQLDGQPMNCLLVNPRAQSVVTSGRLGASSKASAPPAGAASVMPDIETFHKVLFSRH